MTTKALNKNLDIRLLSSAALDEVTALWNEGFKGYPVDMTLSVDRFVARLHLESLSPEKSLIAFQENRPAGFLINGIRNNAGRRVAWNGGTGVAPEFRGQGIGRALVDAALDLYESENVDYAMLEAISTNETAIRLYKNCGYEVVGELVFLEHRGNIEVGSLAGEATREYVVRFVAPPLVGKLAFYQVLVPWQAQWQSLFVNHGSGMIVSDRDGVDAGYALFRNQFDHEGKLAAIALHQCVADSERDDTESILAFMLEHVFAPLDVECCRFTHNFNKSNEVVIGLLKQAGFTTSIEQVLMIKTLRGQL